MRVNCTNCPAQLEWERTAKTQAIPPTSTYVPSYESTSLKRDDRTPILTALTCAMSERPHYSNTSPVIPSFAVRDARTVTRAHQKIGVGTMKVFFLACIAAIVFAVIGMIALNSVREGADQAFSTSAVRLGP